MTDKKSSRFCVRLEYSLDYVKDEFEKLERLRKGGDMVTSVLNKSKVPYIISFATDFHSAEPILQRVTQIGKDNKEYELYNEWRGALSFNPPVCGSRVLEYLISLGVIKNVE